MKRHLLALSAAGLIATPVAAQQIPDTTLKLDAIVAMVGNTPITIYDIERRLADSLAAFGARNAGMPSKDLQKAMAMSALNDLVDEEVLLFKAKEANVEIADAIVSALVDNYMKEVTAQYQSQAQFRQALEQAGYGTPEEFRRTRTAEFRRIETIKQYINQLRGEQKIPTVVIPEAKVREEYDRLRSSGRLPKFPALVAWRQMVIAPQPSAAAKAAAKAKAETLRAEIRGGGDFERVAKRESMDAATKDLGGDLGWRKRGDLPVELETRMFGPLAIRQGDVSPVIESPYGFHLLRIDRSNPPAEVKVRQILIIPQIDSADVVRAQFLTDSLVGALRRGAPFDTIARLFHDRAEEAPGLIPEQPIDSLPASYQAGLRDVKKDSIVSFPIPTAMGYQKFVIAEVSSTAEPGDPSYDKVAPRIRMQLQEIAQMRKFIDDQRKSVYVRVYPERAQEATRIFPGG